MGWRMGHPLRLVPHQLADSPVTPLPAGSEERAPRYPLDALLLEAVSVPAQIHQRRGLRPLAADVLDDVRPPMAVDACPWSGLHGILSLYVSVEALEGTISSASLIVAQMALW